MLYNLRAQRWKDAHSRPLELPRSGCAARDAEHEIIPILEICFPTLSANALPKRWARLFDIRW
jgi:hypothetical protein